MIDNYLQRFKALPQFFANKPNENVGIIVTIPCLDDDFIFQTLDSLNRSAIVNRVQSSIEVIINVNSGECAQSEVIKHNRNIFSELQSRSINDYYSGFRLLPFITEGIAKKKAGVGYARRTAMDEALRRFNSINKPDGIIVSLDADSLVSNDYFAIIMKAAHFNSADCFTFQFRHNYDINYYSKDEIQACKMYEIYLRYYRLALKIFKIPYAIHTIGSCFAIRAKTYALTGGMSPRQGGEDFYFLQKVAKMTSVYEILQPMVFPAPRVSNRVPFGTGPSVKHIIENKHYQVYNFELFKVLKMFYDLFPALYTTETEVVNKKIIPVEIMNFVGINKMDEILYENRKYSSSQQTFVKRMRNTFDAFFIVKFLNSFRDSNDYKPMEVLDAARLLLQNYNIETQDNNLYDVIYELDMKVL